MTRLDFYQRYYADTYAPTIQMSREGIRVNRKRLAQRFASLNATLDALREKLRLQAGHDLFGAKGSLSPKKAQQFFYETLGCSIVYRRKKGKSPAASVDEHAVRTIKKRNKKRPEVVKACDDILAFRYADARKKFCNPKVVDPDGRIRASYYFNTLTLRFGSKKNPLDTGHNLQNPPRDERSHFLPDKGHIFLARDLSQAESRIVYMLTGDEDLVQRALAHPAEYDDHAEIAMAIRVILIREGIIDADPKQPPTPAEFKILRFFGKQANHASNYGETGSRLSEALLELGYVVSAEICQEMIDAKMALRPAILDVFQRGIRRLIATEKILHNPFGHQLDFSYIRRDNAAFRQGYMFIPQSTVPMIMNRWGMVPLYRAIKKHGWDAKIRNQVHDELLVSVHPDDAWEVASFLGKSLVRPVSYRDLTIQGETRQMAIPSTLKIGLDWSNLHEWKAEPSQRAFDRQLDVMLDGPVSKAA